MSDAWSLPPDQAPSCSTTSRRSWPLRGLPVRGRAGRSRALDRAHLVHGRVGLDAADRVPLTRARLREVPRARGHRAAGAAPGARREHRRRPTCSARSPTRPDRRRSSTTRSTPCSGRSQGQRGHPRDAQRRTPQGRHRRPVRHPRQERRDRGAARLLRGRARRPRRPARHDHDPLGRRPDATPRARRAGRAVADAAQRPRGRRAGRAAARVG